MKYINSKKVFESITDTPIPEDFKYCFDNLGDLPGFYLEHKAFDFSIDLKHIDGQFEYTQNISNEIQESVDRAEDLNLKFNRGFIESTNPKCMSSIVCSKKVLSEMMSNYNWLGEEFPDPKKLFFFKYPLFRKSFAKSVLKEADYSFKPLSTDGRRGKEYPISKEDILYSTSVRSISFLFFR